MKMKAGRLAMAVGVCAASVAVAVAHATDLYNYSYNAGGVAATGQLSLDGTFAVGGYINITSGPVLGTFNLYTWGTPGESSIRLTDGTDLIVDNKVDLSLSPSIDFDGLAFVSSYVDSGGHPIEGLNLCGTGASSYGLWGAGDAGGYGVPNVSGTLEFSPASVPEPAMYALFGLAGLALVSLNRNRHRKT